MYSRFYFKLVTLSQSEKNIVLITHFRHVTGKLLPILSQIVVGNRRSKSLLLSKLNDIDRTELHKNQISGYGKLTKAGCRVYCKIQMEKPNSNIKKHPYGSSNRKECFLVCMQGRSWQLIENLSFHLSGHRGGPQCYMSDLRNGKINPLIC